MFEFSVNFDSALRALDKLDADIRRAEAQATRDTARKVIVPAVKDAVSYRGPHAPTGKLGKRTGLLRRSIRPKFFKGRDGLLNGSVQVRGERGYIMRFHEFGTASHGRLPKAEGVSRAGRRALAARSGRSALPARHPFQTVGKAIRAAAEANFAMVFEAQLKMRRIGG